MPVYNSGDTLRAAINSVLSQTYKDFDFIIVDDGSTDNSKEVITSFKDPRIKYYKISHSGRSYASNYGISKSETDFIARIDSDDIFFSNKLELQINYLNNNPNISVIFSHSVLFDDSLRLRYWKCPESNADIKYQLMYLNPINHSSVIFRKSIVTDVSGYSEEMDVNEDYDLWLRISKIAEFHCINEYLVFTRLKNNNDIKLKYNTELKEMLLQYLKSSDVNDSKEISDIKGRIEYYYGDLQKARLNLLNGHLLKNFKLLLMAFIPESLHRKYRGNKYSMLFSADMVRSEYYKRILKGMLN